MNRKLLIVLLLGAALEVAWLYGGLDLIRGKIASRPAGRIMKETNQAKTVIGKASEALKTPEPATTATPPPSPGDPSRNPFALPPGVRLLAEPSGVGEGGASQQELAKAAVPAPPARQLNGILVGPRDRFAIIDGTLVRLGESLEGDRVIDIQRDRVVLARDGQQRTLRLPPPFPELSSASEQLEIRSSAGESQPKRPNGEAKP